MYSSSDGITWTSFTVPFTQGAYGIAYGTDTNGNAIWVATGEGMNSICYSTDNGSTWTGVGTSIFTIGYGVHFNINRFIATGLGTTHTLAYSIDGMTWVGRGKTIFTLASITSVAVGEGTNTLAYSTNQGSTWTGLGATIFTSDARGVAYNGSLYVAVGSGTNYSIC